MTPPVHTPPGIVRRATAADAASIAALQATLVDNPALGVQPQRSVVRDGARGMNSRTAAPKGARGAGRGTVAS